MFSNIFKNKNILITGHTGFKGSWASIWLNYLGANVMGISDQIKTSPSNFKACNLTEYIDDKRVDLKNLNKFRQIVNEFSPDFIFHFAAQSLVSKSFLSPNDTFSTNILSTLNLLEILKDYKSKTVCLFVTSDKVYDNLEWAWGYRETDTLGGKDPYSSSKACCELIIKSYFHSFLKNKDIRIGIGRAGNVIGGGDWNDDRIVPDCVKSWSESKKVLIRNPFSTRPWQHVLEPISGYFRIAQHLYYSNDINGEAFNFGPVNNENFNVKYLIEHMKKFWENGSYEIHEKKNILIQESNLLKLNCDKAILRLNWKPTLNINKTIEYTMTWYKEFYNNPNQSMYDFSCNQIQTYYEIAKKMKIVWS